MNLEYFFDQVKACIYILPMVKNFEEPIGNRVDQIMREAEDRLQLFYKSYGEWDGKSKRPSKKKSKGKSIDDLDDSLVDQDPFLDKLPNKTKIINRPFKNALPEIFSPPPSPIVADLPKNNEVSFEGLSSREIIQKVKEITGVAITICVKSKINVIRHAVIILKEKGFTVK